MALFFLFRNLEGVAEQGVERMPRVVSPEVYQTPIERLELSPRTLNCLKRANINRVGEVLEKSDEDLLKIRNFGEKSLFELQEKLAEHGISSGGKVAEAHFPAAEVSTISIEDLDELMGGGGTDVATLPAGMSFEEAGPAPEDAEESDSGDFTPDDYEDD